MSKLCIALFVAGTWYRSYIPLFLFCLFKAYKYDAVIFLDEPPDNKMQKGIEIAQRTGGRSTIVYDKSLKEYPPASSRAIQSEIYRGQRPLIFNTENVRRIFSKYDYVYLTDVDLLIMPEQPSLLEQHIQHCETLGLPYSNFVRLNTKRLTGLHFMKSKEYFLAIAPVVDKYAAWIQEKGIHEVMGEGRSHGERLLYRIVEESGLGLPPSKCERAKALNLNNYNQVCFGPYHGVHIGLGRSVKRFRSFINTPEVLGYIRQLRLIKKDSRFGQLHNHLDHRGKAALKALLNAATS